MPNVTQYVLSYIRVSEAGLKDRYYLVVRQTRQFYIFIMFISLKNVV